jgi:ACS family tartrate transporter-like MFS transporter
MSPNLSDVYEKFVIRKLLWRLLPFLFLLYVVAYLDRINVGFAALQMRQQLGLSDQTYGLGAGLFFAGYLTFQVPSNLILQRVGARVWISVIMVAWGMVSASTLFASGARSFYAMRFLLGVAEAGFFPGILFYFRSWFPESVRARVIAMFLTAGPVSGIIGGPLSGALLGMPSILGLVGWQWLFLLEGLPAVLLGVVAFFVILDRPENAKWLNSSERDWLAMKLNQEEQNKRDCPVSWRDGSRRPEVSSPSHATLPGRFAALADARIWGFAFIYFALNTCAYGITLWLPISLRGVTGVSNAVLGLLSTIPYVAATIVMVMYGLHSDRTGERRWHTALAATCSACALIAAGYSHDAVSLIAAFSLAIVGVQSMAGPFWVMSTTGLSVSTAAVGIAIINSVGNVGSGVGPYWIGRMRTATGGFRAGLWSVAAMLAIATIATAVVPLSRTESGRNAS